MSASLYGAFNLGAGKFSNGSSSNSRPNSSIRDCNFPNASSSLLLFDCERNKESSGKFCLAISKYNIHLSLKSSHSFPWLEEALGNRWLAPSSLIPYVAHSQGNLYVCLSQLQRRSHYWAHRWSPDDSIPRSSHHGFFSPELQALHLQ